MIIRFLQATRTQVEKLYKTSNETMWNHLHFIGHSLGGQVSGQTAHLLKQDKFWKVERITGLDPANYCFTKAIDSSLRLDEGDADFVDIIHTQGSNEGGLGVGESIGQ